MVQCFLPETQHHLSQALLLLDHFLCSSRHVTNPSMGGLALEKLHAEKYSIFSLGHAALNGDAQ